MNGLLELVFEDVSADSIGSFTMKLIGDEANIVDIHRNGDESLPTYSAFDFNIWSELARSEENSTIFINLNRLNIASKAVVNATLQIVHYKNMNDLIILLSTEDCKKANLVLSDDIYQWVLRISQSFNVTDFFGGLEPADDERTQIYSSCGAGPLVDIS